MARSWQYPRWRRYAMQATMWLVLGATVGLAALVNHERRRSMRVELGPPSTHGWLVVRLPKTWQPTIVPDRDERVVARAVEPDEHGLGRTVTITRDRVAEPISPLEFLLSTNNQILGLELLLAHHARGATDLVEPITVGGYPGVLMRGVRAPGRGGGGGRGGGANGTLPHKEIYGATMLPSGYAIVVKLEGDRPAELSDVEIVKQLVGALEVSGQPSLGQSGETVALEGGIRVNAPDGFRPVYETDENLLRRRLWPDGDATRWAAAELIPCLLAPTENNDETMAIRALAAVHDPALRDAVVMPDGPRRWRITHGGTPAPFAPRGYLVADELGDAGAITGGSPRRAMMAFFHGAGAASADDAASIDAAWDALARSISFVGKTQFGAQLDAGRDEVARLRKEGLPDLLPPQLHQWWLWAEDLGHRAVGWSHEHWTINRLRDPNSPKESAGTRETVMHGPAGKRTRSFIKWNGELRRYEASTTVSASDASADSAMRMVTLADNKLSIRVSSRGNPVLEGNGNAPPQYVSGAWLPLLIGKLSPKPMILKTDSFLAREPIGAPIPMLLIIHPVTEQPPPLTEDSVALRCMSVQVNGSSESSRWYIDPKGEVRRVTFARGLQRTVSNQQTVEFTFPSDFTAR